MEISEELKVDIINDFEEWCIYMVEFMNKNIYEQDILETISDYVSGLYEELVDNLSVEREQFGIDDGLENYDAICQIEDIITKVLIESEVS